MLTELQIRELAHRTGRCRDCSHPDLFDHLDKWGRCTECADEIAYEVARAECAAGWDPNP